MSSMKNEIIRLRREGLSYNEIQRLTGASKGNISYHCSKLEGNGVIIKSLTDKANKAKIKHPERYNANVPEFDTRVREILTELISIGTYRTELSDALNISVFELDAFMSYHNLHFGKPTLLGYERLKLRRKKIKLLAIMRLGGKCEKCGYHKSRKALDFHHKVPAEKEFSISHITNRRWSRVRDEIDKCLLVCANCHRELHDDELG